jgi:hypothetical protein
LLFERLTHLEQLSDVIKRYLADDDPSARVPGDETVARESTQSLTQGGP